LGLIHRPTQPGRNAYMYRAVSIILITSLLGACAPDDPAERLNDYLSRLSRPLAVDDAQPPTAALGKLPRSTSLQLPLQGSALDGLDFLRLRGCALQSTVGRRNSSLGRVAPPSQRLLLELAFLREVPACIEKLQSERGQSELVMLLRETQKLKVAQLPTLIFNATLGNREYGEFWRAPVPLTDYPQQTSSLVITALEQVSVAAQDWLKGDYTTDESALELALSDIARGDGGKLLTAMAAQHSALQTANSRIAARLSESPLCANGLTPNAAPILREVARKFFVGEVQPWAADISQRYHQLLPPILQLEALLGTVLPEQYRDWQRQRDRLLSGALLAPRRHVEALQELLGSCYREFSSV
jgi:hypothetical protein